jgi:long-chain acyl-CoA synthetase
MAGTEHNIFSVFHRTASKQSTKPALIYKQNDQYKTIDYQTILKWSAACGEFLRSHNIKTGDKIALVLENAPSFVWFFFGIMSEGGVAVPLDIQYSDEQITRLVRHSDAKLLITNSKRISGLRSMLSGIPCYAVDTLALDEKKDVTAIKSPVNNFKLAALFYTSGTTDAPKAVMLSHANLLSNINAVRELKIIHSGDVFISLLPLHHTYSFTTTLLLPLLSGAAIAYPKSLLSADILDCLRSTHASLFVGVPQLFVLLHRSIREKLDRAPLFMRVFINGLAGTAFKLRRLTGINLSKLLFKKIHTNFGGGLRFMVSGGARLDPAVETDFYRWGFSLLEGYGLTETSPVVCFMSPRKIKFGSVGRPLPGVKVKINDADENGTGEVAVKGDNVMQGYYKDDAQTGQVLKDGWFFTGDLGYIDRDGFLFLTGRKKELLILPNGENLNPENIEAHYLHSPFIKEIGILSHDEQLVAVIFADEEHFREEKVADLRGRLRWEIENFSEELPSYQRIRGFVISKEPLPRTRLGKLQRFQLPEIYQALQEAAPEQKPAMHIPSEYDPELVKKILSYLSQRLKRPVGIKDHFEIDLGLDSLGRLEVLMGLQDELGLKMSDEEMMDFFLCNTVEEMLGKVKRYFPDLLEKETADPSEQIVRQGLLILSEAVKKDVRPEDHLELDLGLDSLERVEVLLNMQEKLGIQMSDEEAMDFFLSNTVQDLIDKLRRKEGAFTAANGGKLSWSEVLSEEPEPKLKERIMTGLPRAAAFLFNLVIFGLMRIFFKLFYRLQVTGTENLKAEGPYLICPNHTTFYDGPIVSAALPFRLFIRTYFLGDSRFFDHWLLKPFSKWGRLIPIQFTHNMVLAMQACAYVLRHEKILCYFPEGHRSIETQIDEFKKGVGILVKEANVPVIPAYIDGAYDVWPRVRKYPRLFGHIKITFGKPIDPTDIKPEPAKDPYQTIADHIRNEVIGLQKAKT